MRSPARRVLLAAALCSIAGCSCGPQPPELSDSALPDGTAGLAYSATITATGGTPPLRFTTAGMPAGLDLDTQGQLQGTPTEGGDVSLRVTVTDAQGQTATRSYTFTIFPALAFPTSALPTAYTGNA